MRLNRLLVSVPVIALALALASDVAHGAPRSKKAPKKSAERVEEVKKELAPGVFRKPTTELGRTKPAEASRSQESADSRSGGSVGRRRGSSATEGLSESRTSTKATADGRGPGEGAVASPMRASELPRESSSGSPGGQKRQAGEKRQKKKKKKRSSFFSWDWSSSESSSSWRRPDRVIEHPKDFPLGRFPVRVAVLGRGSTFGMPYDVPSKARSLGERVAERGWPLATGGGHGLPQEAEKAAYRKGGETWAISAASTVGEQMSGRFGSNSTTVLYPTGTGGGAGTIEREAPLVQVANVRAYVNGSAGTFGELIAGMHEPGVLAFLEGSGGVGGHAIKRILPHVNVPKEVRVVTSESPTELLNKAEHALGELKRQGVATTPEAKDLFRPTRRQPVVDRATAAGKHIFAFLTDDGGKSTKADMRKTEALLRAALREPIGGKDPIAVFADSATSIELAGRAAGTHKRRTHFVTHESGADFRVRPSQPGARSIRVRRAGTGKGVGEFAAAREVVADADVVFLTSAHFKNLSGLAFALRQSKSSVIAVLEMPSTGSDGLREILEVVKKGPLSERFIFDKSPQNLVRKVSDRLREKTWDDKPRSGGIELD